MGVNFRRPMFADRSHFPGDVNETVRGVDRGGESSARQAASVAGFAALTARTPNRARNPPAPSVQHMGDHDIALSRFIFDRAGLRSVMLVSISFIADAMVTIG
jgi:hypothetical protein